MAEPGVLQLSFEKGDNWIPVLIAATDPGATGPGRQWLDTSGGLGNYALYVRNAANTGWILLIAKIPGESGAGTGTTIISVWDEFIANQMQMAMMLVRMLPGLEGQFPWMRFIVADHAALGLTNHIHAASTMPYDTTTGVFG